MAFDNWLPGNFQVWSELTENSSHPGANDKGYRYRVGAARSIEEARKLVKEDIRAMTNTDTFGGLINWGKVTPREYGIFQIDGSTWKRVK